MRQIIIAAMLTLGSALAPAQDLADEKLIAAIRNGMTKGDVPGLEGYNSRRIMYEALRASSDNLAKSLKSRFWKRAQEQDAPRIWAQDAPADYAQIVGLSAMVCTPEVNYALLFAMDFEYSAGSLRDLSIRGNFRNHPAVQVLLKQRSPDDVRDLTISFIAEGDAGILDPNGLRALWYLMSQVFGSPEEAEKTLALRATREGEERRRIDKFLEAVKSASAKDSQE